MNTQLIKGFFTLCCLAFCLTAFAQNRTNNDAPLQGLWSYSLPDAPDGYQKGTIEFKQVEGKLTGSVKTSYGNYTIREIKKDNQQYTCSLYVDGAEANIKFEQKEGKLTGIVKVDGWEMPMSLTPVKE